MERFEGVNGVQRGVQSIPWLSRDGLRYVVIQQGYRDLTFGARMGPSIRFSNLCHEIGHALEAMAGGEGWRLEYPNFGFGTRGHVPGNSGDSAKPRTLQATERECRVFGIELRLLQIAGATDAEIAAELERSIAIVMNFMPDRWVEVCAKETAADARREMIEASYRYWQGSSVRELWSCAAQHIDSLRRHGFGTVPSPRPVMQL